MRRRRKKITSDLTPLVDVFFIVLFAALIQARAAPPGDLAARPSEHDTGPPRDSAATDAMTGDGLATDSLASDGMTGDAAPGDARPDDARPGDAIPSDASVTAYRTRAVGAARAMASAIQDRPVTIVEVTAIGELAALTVWRRGQPGRRVEPRYPLLVEVPSQESDFELEYRGNRNERHRICAIVRDHLDSEWPAGDAAALASEMVVLVTTDVPYGELPWALRRGLERDAEQCLHGFRGLAIMVTPPATEPEISGDLSTDEP